jgi:hypothetical protein
MKTVKPRALFSDTRAPKTTGAVNSLQERNCKWDINI